MRAPRLFRFAFASLAALTFASCNADVRSPPIASPDLGEPPIELPPCPEGEHLLGDQCVPDGFECATEFPCPDGKQCVGGRCVSAPGPCTTNDDCPTGYQCISGQCAPICPTRNPQCKNDAECGAGNVCAACICVDMEQCRRTYTIDGAPWKVRQDLMLREALGTFGQVFSGIMQKLRDGILKCPPGSAKDCPLFQIIASALPDWAKLVILAVGNLADVIDNDHFYIRSEMLFTPNGKPHGYSGMDHWTEVSFIYQNMFVTAAPEKIPSIGKPVFVPFEASLVCGVIYVDKHTIDGVLSGILRWIVDSVVEWQTCSQGKGVCFHTLGAAIDGAIDCDKVWDPNAKKACLDFRNGLKKTIDDALNLFVVNFAFMTLKGAGQLDGPGTAIDGRWEGTLGDGVKLFKNFQGTWNATR